VRVLEISRAGSSPLDAETVASGLRTQVGRPFPDKPVVATVHLMPAAEGDEALHAAKQAGENRVETYVRD
jgi:hypothetical protein